MLYIWELDRLKGGESGSIPATSGAAVGLQWDKSYFHKFATGSGLGKVIWESYKNDSGYSENMTIEHHNSSKYLHWCTGLACGNLLFPPIWYFAILHGGDSESNDAFIFFIQPNDIRLINLVWGREKSICVSKADPRLRSTQNDIAFISIAKRCS